MFSRKSLLLACSFFAATALSAADKIFPYPYVQEDLPNGLRLITIPTDYPNIVALYIVVGAGSRNEVEAGKTGFAHLFEHLMFRGTPEYSPAKYQSVLQAAGAASNAYTSDDLTAFHTTFSREDLPRILSMEADRFQHLTVDEAAFKTESLAVLGEYNKNSANPEEKMFEVLRETAFKTHTYSHTTMGFLKDVQDMPNQYSYSKQFFDRWYRPEHTTIIVVGDVEAKQVRSMVDERWGNWKRGSYKAEIPAEPAQDAARRAHVDWASSTLPWLAVTWRGPAYTDDGPDTVALDAIARLGFSSASTLYQKLVMDEQKVDALFAGPPDNVDPELFGVQARVKKAADLPDLEQRIEAAVAEFSTTLVDAKKLEELKKHLRYEFVLSLSNSEAVAGTVARYVARRRTPETINRYYELYANLTPEDIRRVAQKYLVDRNKNVVTLTGVGGGK